ncbi:DNA polymerase II [Thalassotalea sp. PLHSN55]|uniref:DNA polymerase II n=1 Tax=Thalassotalea sp. PLHSN55 TaxID=3435888 RepID=UPI003F836F0A
MTNTDNLLLNTGYLLTKQAQDKRHGIVITLWLHSKRGPIKLVVENELALFFIENHQVEQAKQLLAEHNINLAKCQPLTLKAFNQQPVSGFYFKFMRELYQARALLSQHGVKCYEDDFRPDERYLMERFITANLAYTGYEQQQNGYIEVSNAKCKRESCAVELSMVSVDIECSFEGELYSIGLYREQVQCVFIIGDKPDEPLAVEQPYIVWVEDEQALLHAFIDWLERYDPDILIGWNVINFDMNLLQKRCDIHGISFNIGRDGKAPYWRKNKNSEQQFLEISGRVVLDGIDLLKTATYSFPSFSLDHVSNALLGLSKKVDDVDNRIKEITHNFHHNKTALAAYNLEDCRLVWLIFEKTQLLDFAILRSQLTGLAIDRIGGSVAAFTNLYLPKLHRKGYVAPNMGDGHSGLVSPGGFVMDSIPGLYKNILVLDFKSLYPSIIRTFNIDPMGLIEGLKSPEQAIEGFDGAYFSREEHFLPDIINDLWQERDKAKLEKNAALSQAIKIIMNSFYGILGSTGCRFFDPRLSGSITKRSHEILKTTKSWLEDKSYRVIYGDTDSIFVDVGKNKSSDECQHIGKALQDYINDKWQKILKDKYHVDSQLDIEFETHFSQFLMPTIRGQDVGTKKRYAGLLEKNGEQEIVFKGLESVRTDWTELAKQFQRELYHRVFNQLPVKDYIIDMVEKTKAGQFDHLLIYRKRIRRKLSDYVKNVPPHVKAARLADQQNEKLNKPLKYQRRGWIEYYITVNGPQAKEYQSSALDYQLYVDRQLATVADAILPFIGTSFSEIVDAQLDLFGGPK